MLLKTADVVSAVLIYAHVISLSLWFGGLFGYVVIVWPAMTSDVDGAFPRALLARIAMRTAPWIYLAMATALLTLAGIWITDAVAAERAWMVVYSLVLT